MLGWYVHHAKSKRAIEIDNCFFNNSEAVVSLALIFARKINQYLWLTLISNNYYQIESTAGDC